MTAKEYLSQAYRIDRQINMVLAKVDKLRAGLYGRGQQANDAGGKGSGDNDHIGAAVALIVDYENRANELIDKLVKARIEIESTIALLPDAAQREVLERRYLLFQPWESHYDIKSGEYIKGIGEQMNYSNRQIYRIHGEALKQVSVNVSEWQSLM